MQANTEYDRKHRPFRFQRCAMAHRRYCLFLRSLDDKELVRLYAKVYQHAEKELSGGMPYGMDIPTLATVLPQHLEVLRAIHHETYYVRELPYLA